MQKWKRIVCRENNASNAGSDRKHSSDNNLSNSDEPADCVQGLSKLSDTYNVGYKITTLQMAGYASADKDGTVIEEEDNADDLSGETIYDPDYCF